MQIIPALLNIAIRLAEISIRIAIDVAVLLAKGLWVVASTMRSERRSAPAGKRRRRR